MSGDLLPPPFSKAFENMVQGADDTVGLLAYALFKQAIREDAARGISTSGAIRDPSPTTVEVFRNSARRRLEEFAGKAIQEATPDLQQSGVSNAISTLSLNLDTVQANLMAHMDRRTNWAGAILTNLAAWVITLAVTVLIVTAFYLPNWQAGMVDAVKRAITPPASQTGPPP